LLSIRKPLTTAIRQAKIEQATFHDFRDTWASWISQQGIDSYTIMEAVRDRCHKWF